MEDRQRWVNLSFLALSALVAYILYEFFYKLSGSYDLETRVKNIDLIVRGASILVGAAVYFVLYRHEQANQFMNEVVVELGRVTWPARNETTKATMVVMVMVLISGAILGAFDSLWTWLLKFIL